MDKVLDLIKTSGLEIAIIIAVAIIIYYAGSMVMGSMVKRALHTTKRKWHEKDIEKRQKTLTALFKNVWRVLVISVVALGIFTKIFPDVSLAPLFASAGIVGVALGFGAQSLVKDFISGMFIISENQYRVGDVIDIEGASGTVERIGGRSTVIRDADGNVHYFPNGMIQHVINKTMGYSMARFSIAVLPSSDLEKVIAIINETGTKLAGEKKWQSKILKAPAFVSMGEFTSNSVSMLIAGKTQPSDQWAVTAELRQRLLVAFEKESIALSSVAPAAQSKK